MSTDDAFATGPAGSGAEPVGAAPACAGPDPDTAGAAAEIRWDRLPEAVRGRVAELAAAAVAGLPDADVPHRLRRLARFTPAKRARLGARALLDEVERSAAFRAAVLAWCHEHTPGPADVEDPLGAAALAVLGGAPDAPDLVAAAARRGEAGELRAELEAANSRVEKLTAELERLRDELATAREDVRLSAQAREAEFAQLRRRVGEQGARLRSATDALDAAAADLEAVRAEARRDLADALAERDRERVRADRERARADAAAVQVAAARQAAREARRADEVRLELLLETLGGAVAGLRRELSIGGGGPRPADLVAGASAVRPGAPVDDLAALDALLALPAVHLIVDGYNVSKTGYPELPLADQRTRLVGQLAALAARTGVEVTVVFDGAGVVAAPTRGTRGVRVLFSDAGVIADDVIRALVAAEPEGRPILVATSDRAVVESVRRRGAHALPSAILLGRLRG
ncbi:NYN domain-containing protein [Pseudonocardia dioxanivorans]|uniref:NYN domain-containing protein n=1 Tax=Pseudonocardia dioxanivorans TaxID=240495 RepID=UPI0018F89EAD|nr:NYN domain-containing protein [Pseudonocardia dioxanivorans]